MSNSFLKYFTRPRINDPYFFILTGSDQSRAVPVPARGVNDIRMTIYFNDGLASPHVPYDHKIIRARGQQDIQGRWMPEHQTNSSLMQLQVDNWLRQCAGNSTVRNLPYFYNAVLRTRCNYIVIVRTPGDI